MHAKRKSTMFRFKIRALKHAKERYTLSLEIYDGKPSQGTESVSDSSHDMVMHLMTTANSCK
jgi:hypothetical protein